MSNESNTGWHTRSYCGNMTTRIRREMEKMYNEELKLLRADNHKTGYKIEFAIQNILKKKRRNYWMKYLC